MKTASPQSERNARKLRTILIIDPDAAFQDALRSDSKAARVPPVLARNGRDGQLLIADRTRSFAGIFVNPAVKDLSGISVIRAAHFHRPATPIFLLCEDKPPYFEAEMKELGIQKSLVKPVKYADLLALSSPVVIFDPEVAAEIARKTNDPLDQELAAEDAEFVPIRAHDFLAGTKSFFDVYVRISAGKYVKVIHAGDAFAPDRIVSYLNKGVIHFFIRKGAQETYLTYCDKLATAVLGSDKAGFEIKVSQTLNHGEETIKFLRAQGLSEERLMFASEFVLNVQDLVRQLMPRRHTIMDAFLADVASYEHAVGVTIIAALMVDALHLEAAKSVEMVGVASLFHDLGLYALPPECLEENPEKLAPELQKKFHEHPALGADMLAKIPGIDPAAIQAVAQHHSRRNRNGFPRAFAVGQINRVAEIVGIADEVTHVLPRMKADPKLTLAEEMKERLQGFSFPVAEAFRGLFPSPKEDAKP